MKKFIHESIHGYQYRFSHFGFTYKSMYFTESLNASLALSAKLRKLKITRAEIQPVQKTRF